jgi:proline iminopeptidase
MRVKVNGVRLFFEVAGSKLDFVNGRTMEKPTLLVLHGGPGFDHQGMRPYFDRFSDVAQVVHLDHRANGRSEPGPRQSWNLYQWGDDVREFCRTLDIERPVVLGHSFGGFVAQSYVTRYPEHPAKVILSSTAATTRFDRSVETYRRLGGDDVAAVAQLTFDEPRLANFIDFQAVCTPLYHQTDGHGLASRPGIFTPDVLIDFWRNGVNDRDGALKSFDFRAALMNVRCPVLVLGGEDDPACPIEDQRDMVSFLPPALSTFVTFADCGHGTYFDFPDETDVAIRKFLADWSSERAARPATCVSRGQADRSHKDVAVELPAGSGRQPLPLESVTLRTS